MDFAWSEEQLAFKEQVIKFAQDNLNGDIIERDYQGKFSEENWRKCAEFGIQGLFIPEEYGGSGTDILTTILMMEGLGYGCRDNGLPFALNSQMWSLQTVILKAGTEEQKKKYLPGLCRGDIFGAFAITEEDTGSDAYGMKTCAQKCEGGYILNGRKSYITLAPVADIAVVFATLNPKLGFWGITAFIVDKEMSGFETSSPRKKMGMQTTPMGDLIFKDCYVPLENRLGAEGGGATLFSNAMESERGYIFASQVGAMDRQIEEAVKYARERCYSSGQPIGKFQSVSNRIADMKVRLETARNLLYKVAWLDKMGKPLLMEAAIAKLYLSECFVQSSLDSIRTFGAKGYVSEFEIERDLRDGIGGLIYSGTSDIQRNIIARLLGVGQ